MPKPIPTDNSAPEPPKSDINTGDNVDNLTEHNSLVEHNMAKELDDKKTILLLQDKLKTMQKKLSGIHNMTDVNLKDNKTILFLQRELNKLQDNFDNHYHDIPTTGVKQFKKNHPYYQKND